MCVISLCTRGALDTWSRGRSTAALGGNIVSTAFADVVAWFQERQGLCYYAASFVCVCLLGVLIWAPFEVAHRGWIMLAVLAAGVAFRVLARRAR